MRQSLAGRAQAPEPVRPEQLRPQSQDYNTYARPATSDAGSNLDRLAKSLGQIAPSLTAYLSSRRELEKDDAETWARSTIAGKSFEDVDRDVREGRALPLENPYRREAYNRLYAVKLANETQRKIAEEYGTTFDREKGNVTELIAKHASLALETLDENTRATFQKAFEGFQERLLGQKLKDTNDAFVRNSNQIVSEGYRLAITEGLSAGETPEQIHASIRSLYPGYQKVMGVDPASQDEALFGLVESLAAEDKDGKYEAVIDRILKDDRGGVGPLENKTALLKRAVALRSGIHKQALLRLEGKIGPEIAGIYRTADEGALRPQDREAFEKKYPGVITPNEWTSLEVRSARERDALRLKLEAQSAQQQAEQEFLKRQQAQGFQDLQAVDMGGNLLALGDREYLDAQGDTKTETAADRRERVWFLKQMQISTHKDKDGKTLDPATQRQLMIDWAARNAYLPKAWKELLDMAPVMTTGRNTVGAEVDPVVEESLTLARELYLRAPQMFQSITGDRAFNFYQTYLTLLENGYGEQAALQATNLVHDPDKVKEGETIFQVPFSELDAKVRGFSNTWVGRRLSFNLGQSAKAKDIESWGLVAPELQNLGRILIRLGMSPTDALDSAATQIAKRSVAINGVLVGTRGMQLPPDFVEIAEAYLQDFAERNPNEEDIDDGTDIALRPIGNGGQGWQMVDAKTLIPLQGTMQMSDLEYIRQKRRNAAANAVIKEQQKRTAPSPVPDYFPPL